jgi:hypothetical protein
MTPACVSANINPVSSRVHVGWASRMNVPRRGWDLLKTLIYLIEIVKYINIYMENLN